MGNTLECRALSIRKSPIHGYGVFAAETILPGTVIEESYALIQKDTDVHFINYSFACEKTHLLLLGCGSLYNHSDRPNASYDYDVDRQVMIFKALRAIGINEEIFIDYGDNWFGSRNAKPIAVNGWRKLHRFKAIFNMASRFIMVTGALMAILMYLSPALFLK
jgi:hypothetical protein